MKQKLIEEMFEQQVKVLIIISCIIVLFILSFTFFTYKVVPEESALISMCILYAAIILLSLFSLRFYQKAFHIYMLIIVVSFFMLIMLTLYTGGLYSPVVFILCTIPIGAYNTSRKQGKTWVAIILLAIIFLYKAESWELVRSIVPEDYHFAFLLGIVLFVFGLITIYSIILKNASYQAFRSYNMSSVELEEKTKRLDNLVMFFNRTPALMCVIDLQNLTFEEVNPHFKLELGYELIELRGQHISNVFIEKSVPAELNELKSDVKEGKRYSFVATLKSKTGKERPFDFNAVVQRKKLFATGWEIDTKPKERQETKSSSNE
ncbi:MAG: hypothetical protein COA57_16510 [Flavobacteriales bacterium]|nr:MAG: hypothetical protein COA57_16510 [Flavobacteriales bacterium]